MTDIIVIHTREVSSCAPHGTICICYVSLKTLESEGPKAHLYIFKTIIHTKFKSSDKFLFCRQMKSQSYYNWCWGGTWMSAPNIQIQPMVVEIFHSNLSHGGCKGNVRGSPKSEWFIHWGPWMSVKNVTTICPIVVVERPQTEYKKWM